MANSPVYILGGSADGLRAQLVEGGQAHRGDDPRSGRRAGSKRPASTRKDVQVGHVGNFAAELYSMQGHLGRFSSSTPTLRSRDCRLAATKPRVRRARSRCSPRSAEIEAGRYDLLAGRRCRADEDVSIRQVGGDYLGTAAWYETRGQGRRVPVPQALRQARGRVRQALRSQGRAPRPHLRDQLQQRQAQPAGADTHLVHDRRPRHARPASYNTVIGGRIKVSGLLAGDGRRGVAVPGIGEVRAPSTPSSAACSSSRSRGSSAGATAPRRSSSTTKVAESRDRLVRPAAHAPGDRRCLPTRRRSKHVLGRSTAIETHDCFTTSEYMAIDHFGAHRARRVVEGGRGGRDRHRAASMPINPSGGLIGAGHPVGCDRRASAARRLVAGDRNEPATIRWRTPSGSRR